MTLHDLFEANKNVTIKAATGVNGDIDRGKADRILDPHDYFGKNKRKNGFKRPSQARA